MNSLIKILIIIVIVRWRILIFTSFSLILNTFTETLILWLLSLFICTGIETSLGLVYTICDTVDYSFTERILSLPFQHDLSLDSICWGQSGNSIFFMRFKRTRFSFTRFHSRRAARSKRKFAFVHSESFTFLCCVIIFVLRVETFRIN